MNIKESLPKYIDDFLNYLKEHNNSTENTITAYKRDLNRFCDYVSGLDINSYDDITKDHISDFKFALGSQMLSSPSIARTLSAVRSLLQYLMFINVIESNPARKVPNDPTVRRLPAMLTRDEVEALLSQPSGSDCKSVRDNALLEMLYGTGLKVTEIIQMNVDDVNLPLSIIKGTRFGREYNVPLYPVLEKKLSSYILNARNLIVESKDEKALFVNMSGRRISRQGIGKILDYYVCQAGINTEITLHTLRYSFAMHLIENGADVHDVQVVLGHTDISSTQRYVQLFRELKQSDYMIRHPRAEIHKMEM